MSKTSSVVSVTTPTDQIIDIQTGKALYQFIKWMQQVGQLLNQVFNSQGALSPDSIPFPTSAALGGVTSAGPVKSQWINAIDTKGSPQLSQPGFSDVSGQAVPAQIPSISQLNGSLNASQVPPLSSLSGAVKPSQVPVLSDLEGSVTAAQVPALSALSGRITDAQLPVGGLTVTITTAALTTVQGSMTFTNGILTAQVPAS
jgi:hypothetical protein